MIEGRQRDTNGRGRHESGHHVKDADRVGGPWPLLQFLSLFALTLALALAVGYFHIGWFHALRGSRSGSLYMPAYLRR